MTTRLQHEEDMLRAADEGNYEELSRVISSITNVNIDHTDGVSQ